MTLPRLILTPGEPGGIGPDLCLALARRPFAAQWIVCADPRLMQKRAKALGHAIEIKSWTPDLPVMPQQPGQLWVWDVARAANLAPGIADPANARYVLDTLRLAVQGCLDGNFDALVTGPVQKSSINDGGIAFTGHTEYLAELTHSPLPVMMLATEGLRVALVTTHVPVTAISGLITRERVTQVLRILDADLQKLFALPRPRILVCGLNPHAGEGGHCGREEIEQIIPALDELRAEGLDLRGPLPADTLFTPPYLDNADAVLAMYHDQGLPVLKFKGFGKAINVTLGLPIIRTSVDHGTALDLAGTGKADASSLELAMHTALIMAKNKTTYQSQAH